MNAEETVQALHKTAEMMINAANSLERGETQAKQLADARLRLDHHERCWARIERALPPDPNLVPDFAPLVERVLYRLEETEKLRRENEALKSEITTLGNHAICRLNVLKDIHRVLGSDGGETGASMLTGVPPELYRLPKRIERLIRENETLARNMPPEPPAEPALQLKLGGTYVRSNGGRVKIEEIVGPEARRFRFRGDDGCLYDKNGSFTVTPNSRDLVAEVEPSAEPQGSTLDHGDGSGYVRQATDSTDAATLRLVGHQWYRTKQHDCLPSLTVHIAYPEANLVLCAVYQNVVTGALTHTPVCISDLEVL